MTKEGRKQSKLKQFMLGPVRILKKARQLYLKSVVKCAGGYGVVDANRVVHSQFPLFHMTNTINLNGSRTTGNEGHRQKQVRRNIKMSSIAEVRNMEKIDEDQELFKKE